MKPDQRSKTFLAITRSKGKMYEYAIPERDHIAISIDPSKLLVLSIGILGDVAANRSHETTNLPLVSPQFSASFFDSYIQSKLNVDLDQYLRLMGSAAYYLSDLPGSSKVLANLIVNNTLDLDCSGLENLLTWLLQGKYSNVVPVTEDLYRDPINDISELMTKFSKTGSQDEDLIRACDGLHQKIYKNGSPRELLFSDAIGAVVKKKLQNSVWRALPSYSDLPKEIWAPIFQKSSSIKELWPAQHLLGQKEVFKGKSAMVQMPTSAGKTKATELIIRSSFLANRTSLVIIVAPFRALCHEIKNSLSIAFQDEQIAVDEMTDVLQMDFTSDNLLEGKQILVVTPEKLMYALRHNIELASKAGLVIFDEGHQFDNGARGITYELLLTSLRSILSTTTQKIIISAVISNADAIGEWFNGTGSTVVSGTDLVPTFRSVGFVSWLDQAGRVEYVSSENIEESEYFVPRVIETYPLSKKPREKKERIFPDKSDSQAIALYLGLKLVKNGSVAIFCGKKSIASSICAKAVDIFEREVSVRSPGIFSDQEELNKLYFLYLQNLGREAISTKSARLGVYTHHGNTPQGIRLAVEYAMQRGLIHFVVCTSTLAQGINLPIRYLVVTSLYQGLEKMRVRDFHNLIGRAGRSGMYTEGSILFADPLIFDRRRVRKDMWRWGQVKNLFTPENSEPCISNLLSIFDPIKSDDDEFSIKMDAMAFVKIYVDNPEEITSLSQKIVTKYGDKGFSLSGVERQILEKMALISSIESFLMSNWDITEEIMTEEKVVGLAKGTFAYSLADEKNRQHICNLFKLLASNISQRVKNTISRKAYGKTLYGIRDAQIIDQWVHDNISQLSSVDADHLLDVIWPLLNRYINNNTYNKCDKPSLLKDVVQGWISGKSFYDLLKILHNGNAKLLWGKRCREYNIENLVEMCEVGLAYGGALLLGAINEFVDLLEFENKQETLSKIRLFQKRLKYGLPSTESVVIFEMGFSDRAVSQELANKLGQFNLSLEARSAISTNIERVKHIVDQYPSYYGEILKRYV
ncbi:MAG: DEAD/DEAH box helicase [Candidatus Omnitrophica bacterium]|nr:DEAD/DEAH box helicase [Candidatus Omnitrophota bacterium]